MRWPKIIGAGCVSVVGVVGGLALEGLIGAALVAVSLFIAVVVAGFAVAGLVGALEIKRVRTGRAIPRRVRPVRSRSRCRSCGRKRGSFGGVLVCQTCDAIPEATDTIAENTLPG